uniref:Uncharacterized protein n=1 Tax=Rhizophora mucronata TaxID=61149 RepID=A0A2P2PIR2_RHIMU
MALSYDVLLLCVFVIELPSIFCSSPIFFILFGPQMALSFDVSLPCVFAIELPSIFCLIAYLLFFFVPNCSWS